MFSIRLLPPAPNDPTTRDLDLPEDTVWQFGEIVIGNFRERFLCCLPTG